MTSRIAKALTGLTGALISACVLAGDVVYKVGDEAFEGYWLSAGKSAPLVIIAHDWDGLTGYEQKRAAMLQALGYNVFALDLFGQGVRPQSIEDRRQHTGALYKDRDRLRALMKAGAEAARAQGGDLNNMVVMGYCFGGAAVLELARSGFAAKGYATFHGGLQTPEGQSWAGITSPVLVMHGSADDAITLTDFATLGQELEAAHVPHELITYSGAPHAFTVFGSDRYREEADAKSWARFTGFLGERTAF
ncbi:dienelactone hydrolase family protein [Thalassolituus sp. LLYu03]|uniref:dienelactone hydrolase family protein n=1 Tax=Thalassolituus sp. LLYu03 TaxID=3421656 RepID=UPI003D2AAE3F